jgi:hypothetical protein
MNASYGIMAEFSSPENFTAALRRVREAGCTKIEVFMPFAVEEALELLPRRRTSPVARAMALGGLISGAGAYFMQFYATHDYPIDVGGRPLNSWPSFVPITFELTVLGAALTGVFSFFVLAGFPRLEHPVFSDPRFGRASQDRFFICLRSDDPRFDRDQGARLLAESGAESVAEVPL